MGCSSPVTSASAGLAHTHIRVLLSMPKESCSRKVLASFQNKMDSKFFRAYTLKNLVKTKLGKRYHQNKKASLEFTLSCFPLSFWCPTSAATKMDFGLQRNFPPDTVCDHCGFCLRERSDEDAARKKDVERSVMTNIAPRRLPCPSYFM